MRRLNDVGVPLAARLLLRAGQLLLRPRRRTRGRALYDDFRTWSRRHELRFDAVSIHFERSIEDLRRALEPGQRRSVLWDVVRRLGDAERSVTGSDAYRRLIHRVHGDGLAMEG